jgi:ribosomal protein L16 Arg81 hydroxylase
MLPPATMLATWVESIARPRFFATHWGRRPFACPSDAAACVAALQWDALDRVLAANDADVLTLVAGHRCDGATPRCAVDVRRLMRRGISTVVRGAERHDVAIATIAASFASIFPGEVHVQLCATPAGTRGNGWHYDFADAFIAQTLGARDHYFRDNTVARDTRLGDRLDFGCVRDEPSQLMAARLLAGDWLYLPRRWWHLVECVADSLSLSVGVMPPEPLR